MELVPLTLCVLFAAIHVGFCQLGETLSQCEQKYGSVLQKDRQGWHTFKKEPYYVLVHFYDGKADAARIAFRYTIDANIGALTPITGPPFPAGRNPIFVAVVPSGKFAYVANHADGIISGYTSSPATAALTLHSLLDNLRGRTEKFRSSRLECTNARSPDRIGRPAARRLAPALREQSRADASAISLALWRRDE
jgi:hypothetical protein